jgi:hypothetical protein
MRELSSRSARAVAGHERDRRRPSQTTTIDLNDLADRASPRAGGVLTAVAVARLELFESAL